MAFRTKSKPKSKTGDYIDQFKRDFTKVLSDLRRSTKVFLKRLGVKKIIALILIFMMLNIGIQVFFVSGITNAKFEVIDIQYGGNKGTYSLLYTRLLVINTGPTPIYLPELKIEIKSLDMVGIEARIYDLNVPAHSVTTTTVEVRLYHNQATQRVITGLLEEGKLDGDITVYLPLTLFGVVKVGYLPVTVPQSVIQSVLSSLTGGSGGEGESSTTVTTQSIGLEAIVGAVVYSLEYGELKLNQLVFMPETEKYAELYISLSGSIPENLQRLGNITINKLIIDVITDDYGSIATMMMHPTSIDTSSGHWDIALSLRLYKDADLGGFVDYFMTNNALPPGRAIITADLVIFDIELHDIQITVDFQGLSNMVSTASYKAAAAPSEDKARVNQIDNINDLIMNIFTQNSDFLQSFISAFTSMFSIRNVEYEGFTKTDAGNVHDIKVEIGVSNELGWTFGLRDFKISLAYENNNIIIIEIPGEFVLEPSNYRVLEIHVKGLEGHGLEEFINKILTESKIIANINVGGDINLLGNWIRDFNITLPLDIDLSSILSIGTETETNVQSASYLLTSAVFSIASGGNFRTAQFDDFISTMVKHIRLGGFDIYEEKGYLKLYTEVLYEIAAFPFAIDDLNLDVFYKATHLMSIQIPSFDLRPNENSNDRVVRRILSTTLAINEDNQYIYDIIASALNGDMSFLDYTKISGSVDLVLFGVEIKNIPIRLDGSMFSSFLSSASIPSNELNNNTTPIEAMPFPVDIANILPPELLAQLVQIVDITTEPTVVEDGIPIYTIKIIIRLDNPTSVTLSMKDLDIRIQKKLPIKDAAATVLRVYLEDPVIALPRSSDTGIITIKFYANDELEVLLNELLRDFMFDATINGTIHVTIGRFDISNINIVTDVATTFPESVISGIISSIIAAFQQFLTIDELLNMLIPQEETSESESSTTSGLSLGGIDIGNPIIKSVYPFVMEYEDNVTMELEIEISNLTLPLSIILDNITIDLFYENYLDKPVMALTFLQKEIGERDHEMTLKLIMFKDAGGFEDFIKAIFYRRSMSFVVNFYANFTFLGFRFENISLEGISISLPPYLPSRLELILPSELISGMLGLDNSEEDGGSDTSTTVPEIPIPLNFFRLDDVEYLGLSSWRGYPAHRIRVNLTIWNIFNLTFGINDSSIEIFHGESTIPALVVYINGSYEYEINKTETLFIDIYVIENPETELLLNELFSDYTVNMTVSSTFNLKIFGVTIDSFTFSTYLLAELKDTIKAFLTDLSIGSLISSTSDIIGSQTSSIGLEPIRPELIEELISVNVKGFTIEEYKDYAVLYLSLDMKSDKIELTVDNITLDLKLSWYNDTALTITLANSIELIKGVEDDTQIKLIVWKKDPEQLEELFTNMINFGVLTLDINISLLLTIFNMNVQIPLEINRLEVNMTEVLGANSLKDLVWSMLVPSEGESGEESESSIPIPINFDLGAIIATLPLTQMIEPLNVTFEDPISEDGATVYRLKILVKLNNPYKLNLTIYNSILNITKNNRALITLEIMPVFIPELGSANVSIYAKFYYYSDYDYTRELLQNLINGESYDANITGGFQVGIFGIDLPKIELVLPLDVIFGSMGGEGEGSSSEVVDDLMSMLNDFLPALQNLLTPILLLAKVNLTEFSITENSTGAYTHIVISISGIKAPIAIRELKLQLNYTNVPIVDIYLNKQFDLTYGEDTLDLLIVAYNNTEMSEFLTKLLHDENVTISALANLSFMLFRDEWTFEISATLDDFTFSLSTLLGSESETGSSDTGENTFSMPLPSISVGISLPFTLTDIVKVYDIKYLGAVETRINGVPYQKHLLQVNISITDKFNITLGWSNPLITLKDEYDRPLIDITLSDLLLHPEDTKNLSIIIGIYDTPYTKDFIEQLAQLTGFYTNISLHFDTLTIFGVTISDIDLGFPINMTDTGEDGGTSGFDIMSLLPIDEMIGDISSLMGILPPLDTFFSDISLENISLYEEPGKVVFEVKVRIYDLLLPVHINGMGLTLYYPVGSGNPVVGIHIEDDVTKPSRDLGITVKLFIYKSSSYYSSEAFYKLLHGEDIVVELLGQVNLWLFGSNITDIPSYLDLSIPIEISDLKLGGINPADFSTSSGSSETSESDITSQISSLVTEILSNATQFLDNLVKIGNFAFGVVDETEDYAELKFGIMLKLPVEAGIEDLRVYLKGSEDINTEFAALSLTEEADFAPNEWAPLYLRIRLLKNQYLEDFLVNLLKNWNLTAYADITLTMRIGTVTIRDVTLSSIELGMEIDPEMFSSILSTNLLGSNTTLPGSGSNDSPPVPDMPQLTFDLNSLILGSALIGAGYGDDYDPTDKYGGVKEILDSSTAIIQPWKHKMISTVTSTKTRTYVYYLIAGKTYTLDYISTDGGTAYFRIIDTSDGSIIKTGSADDSFSVPHNGFYKIEFYTSDDEVSFEVELYESTASGWTDPWNYNWITIGTAARLDPAYPNVQIKNMRANLYYLGEYYTFDADGTPIPTGTYATGGNEDFIGEIYAPSIEISTDSKTDAFILIRFWRVTREDTTQANNIDDFFASALLGNISLMISDISMDINIFGAQITNLTVPIKLNISLSFKISDFIKPNPKRGAGGSALPFNAAVDGYGLEGVSISLDGISLKIRLDMKMDILQLGAYLVYLDLDVYADDDPQFGFNDSLVGYQTDPGTAGPYIARLFSDSATPYVSGRDETPRMVSVQGRDPSNYLWLGGGGGRVSAYTGYMTVTDQWAFNFGADYLYDDETEKTDDCYHKWDLIIIAFEGWGDMYSLGITHFKIEVVMLWWVIDLYLPAIFFEISSDLNQNIALGYVYGMENMDSKDFQPDATEWWYDPWFNNAHGDGCGYY